MIFTQLVAVIYGILPQYNENLQYNNHALKIYPNENHCKSHLPVVELI